MNHLTKPRRLFLGAALLCLAATGSAQQEKSQEEYIASFEEMLTHSWYTDGGWTTDFTAAKAKAKETGKPILAYFTRTSSF